MTISLHDNKQVFGKFTFSEEIIAATRTDCVEYLLANGFEYASDGGFFLFDGQERYRMTGAKYVVKG